MTEEITYGGFFKANIRRWIVRECLQSGNPDSFFMAIEDIVDEIREHLEDDPDYWDDAYGY